MRVAIVGFVVIVGMAVAGTARPAGACSPLANHAYETDRRDGTDALPPGDVTVGVRFETWHEAPCFRGVVTLDAHAVDDRSSSDVGFVVQDVSDALLWDAPAAVVPWDVPGLVFYTREVEVPFELDVRAVDRWGNVGPATRVTVAEVAWQDEADGCSVGAARGGGVTLVLAALAALRRRRPAAA